MTLAWKSSAVVIKFSGDREMGIIVYAKDNQSIMKEKIMTDIQKQWSFTGWSVESDRD